MMNDIMGSLRYGNPHQQQQYEKEQQEKAMQDDRYRTQAIPPAPTAPSPISLAVDLIDERICRLQDVTDKLFIKLNPITSSSDDCYPAETPSAREGNSDLNRTLNAMAERLGAIAHALQLQVDRLEV
jgi:hypothetical protein